MIDMTLEEIRRALSSRATRTISDTSFTPAAVLLLLYARHGEYYVIFNKRSQEVEHHKGEISFPGGMKGPEDKDLRACALREAWEEMGICPEDVSVLGELDTVVTQGTRFAVYTFVGTIPYPYRFNVSATEVAEVLEAPLSALFDPRNQREEVYLSPDGVLARSYAYAYNHHLIYGATARILRQFLTIFRGPL